MTVAIARDGKAPPRDKLLQPRLSVRLFKFRVDHNCLLLLLPVGGSCLQRHFAFGLPG